MTYKETTLKLIIGQLHQKYQPRAIILHGSRLTGDAGDASDYDLTLVVEHPDTIRPEEYQGHMLDLAGIRLNETILKAGNTPIWPCELLYEDEASLGTQLLKRTKQAYDAGPQSLSPIELVNRKNYTKRLLQRLELRGEDPMVRNYYLSDFYDRVIRYWFELRQLWTCPIYKALPEIAEKDPEFYQRLTQLWTEAFLQAAQEIYDQLFGWREVDK